MLRQAAEPSATTWSIRNLSPELQQAQEMADKKALLFGGEPTVTRFEFDEAAAMADPEIASLRYEHYCVEWGKFVQPTPPLRVSEYSAMLA